MGQEEVMRVYGVYKSAWTIFRDAMLGYQNTDAYAKEVEAKMMQLVNEQTVERGFARELMSVLYARLTGRTTNE